MRRCGGAGSLADVSIWARAPVVGLAYWMPQNAPDVCVPHGLVVGWIAGGPGALLKAVEGAEDSQQAGEARSCRANPQEIR